MVGPQRGPPPAPFPATPPDRPCPLPRSSPTSRRRRPPKAAEPGRRSRRRRRSRARPRRRAPRESPLSTCPRPTRASLFQPPRRLEWQPSRTRKATARRSSARAVAGQWPPAKVAVQGVAGACYHSRRRRRTRAQPPRASRATSPSATRVWFSSPPRRLRWRSKARSARCRNALSSNARYRRFVWRTGVQGLNSRTLKRPRELRLPSKTKLKTPTNWRASPPSREAAPPRSKAPSRARRARPPRKTATARSAS